MHIIVGVPAYGERIHAGLARALMIMAVSLAKAGIAYGFQYCDSALLDRARNKLVTTALREKADWLLMIDADTVPTDVGKLLAMIRDAGKAGASVVGAPVQQRRRAGWNVRRAANPRDPMSDCFPMEDFDGQVKVVDRIGSAVLGINMSWLRSKWPIGPWFRSEYQERGDDPKAIGEDFYFCGQVCAHDGVIVADWRVPVAHFGATSETETIALLEASGSFRRPVN